MAATRSSASSTCSPASARRDPLVLARGEDERQRRRAVAQVDAGRLAGRVEVAGAVEDVVGDLEGDAEREPERAELGAAAAEDARGLEELAGLQRAAQQVLVDGRVGPEGLPALERLAAGERERGLGEHRDARRVPGRGELGERPREEVVAGRLRGAVAVLGPRGRAAAAQVGAVEQVVVDERRHVDELDRGAGGDGALAGALLRRRAEEDEHRPQALAAGRERLGADLADEPGMGADRALEPHLEQLEVGVEPGRRADGGERAHSALLVAVCSATIPPPSSRQRISPKPARRIASARSSGPGKRRTLAGRYV